MNSEDRDILKLIENLSDDEIVKLMDDMSFEEVKIDDAAKGRMKKNVLSKVKPAPGKKTSRIKRGLIAAGITAVVALSALSPTGQRALADILKKLYFVPGAGRIVENEKDIYILQRPVKYSDENRDITVESVTKSDYLSVRMAGDGTAPNLQISIIDNMGKEYKSSHGIIGGGYGWSCEFSFSNIPENLTSFKLVPLNNVVIPITLVKAESYEDFASMGPTDIKNNLGLTLVPTKVDDKIKFDLIQHSLEGRQVYRYGTTSQEGRHVINVNITDDKGNSIKAEHPVSYMGTLSEFYFTPLEGSAKYTVQIPEATLEYKVDNEIVLPVPEGDGEMLIDKSITMKGFTLSFTKVIRNGNKVRFYVDAPYDESAPENFSVAHLDGDYGYGFPLKENLTVNYYEIQIEPGIRKFKLKFNRMETIMKGPWSFEIKGE